MKGDFVETYLEQAADSFDGPFSYEDLRREAKSLIRCHLEKRLDIRLPVGEAAALLGISAPKVKGWIRQDFLWAEKREIYYHGQHRVTWFVKVWEVREVYKMSRSERYWLGKKNA